MRVREKNDLAQWFKFFLVGIIETAKNSIKTFDGILRLQKEVNNKIQLIQRRSNSLQLVMESLYQHPLIDPKKVKKITNLSLPSAYKIIEDLKQLEIISRVNQQHGKQYLFTDYINLFK